MVGRHRIEPWEAGFAARRDWPDRTHEFVRFARNEASVAWFVDADRAYWRRGPWRPGHEIVVISLRDFELHRSRPGCRAPDCPTGPASVPRPQRSSHRH
jgi:hypothetical protein